MKLFVRLFRPGPGLLAAMIVIAGCAGCAVVPVGAFTEPPYPDEVLQPLLRDSADRNQVQQALGKPRAVKSGGKYWFYTSSSEFLGIIGGSSSAVLDDYEWVMVEFDASDRVVSLEHNDDLNGCLANGICYLAGFLSPQPVITAPAAEAATVESYQPGPGECAVYLYLEDLPWYYGDLPVLFSVDGNTQGLVTDKSYLFLTHPDGEMRVSAWQQNITAPCRGGNRLYIKAVKAPDWSWQTAEDLAPDDPVAGKAAIHDRRLALPDRGGR